MRVSTSQFQFQGISAITKHQNDILDIQEKLSTGKRINKPSDDPVGANQVTSLKKMIANIDQFKSNGEFAKSQLVLEETQMTTAVDVVQRARELTLQMMNGTYGDSDKQAAGMEVSELIEHLKNVMNSVNSDKELLFAGNNVNEPAAFVEDVNNPGYFAYIGSANATGGQIVEANYGSRFVQISFDANNTLSPDDKGDSSRVRITDNGGKIFDVPNAATSGNFTGGVSGGPALANQPDANVLNLMVELKAYLLSGDAIPDSIAGDFDLAVDSLSKNLAEIGGRQNRIESQADAGDAFKLALEERRMNIEDMDLVEGTTSFTLKQNALQMAQQVFAKVQGMSLFNYM